MLEPQPLADNASSFARLWKITQELRQKLEASFELHPDPAIEDLQNYSSRDGNVKGSLNPASGAQIDKLVHGWLGNPEKSGFSTMRLTVWLGAHIGVPHLAFEFSTRSNLFFYIDYIPRSDLLVDMESLDRYYEPVNQSFLTLQADPRLSSFTSKSLYIRQFQSPVSLCYTCMATEETLELIRRVSHEMLDRWLTWVQEAEPVAAEAQTALRDRDLLIRRTSAERDPGNKLAMQMFGTELTEKLIEALWRRQ